MEQYSMRPRSGQFDLDLLKGLNGYFDELISTSKSKTNYVVLLHSMVNLLGTPLVTYTEAFDAS